jgi:hypothetical protein
MPAKGGHLISRFDHTNRRGGQAVNDEGIAATGP